MMPGFMHQRRNKRSVIWSVEANPNEITNLSILPSTKNNFSNFRKQNSTTEFHMRANGLMEKDKDSEFKFGLMARNMLDSGKITKPTDREPCTMPMETSTKESGLMTKPVDKEPTHTKMVPNMSENGRTISKTVTEFSNGQTAKSTKESTRMELKQAKAS